MRIISKFEHGRLYSLFFNFKYRLCTFFKPLKYSLLFLFDLDFGATSRPKFAEIPSELENKLSGTFAAPAKTSAMRDALHVRHGILIRRECWPTAKRPQRFLNTRRKCLAFVPSSHRRRGWYLAPVVVHVLRERERERERACERCKRCKRHLILSQ